MNYKHVPERFEGPAPLMRDEVARLRARGEWPQQRVNLEPAPPTAGQRLKTEALRVAGLIDLAAGYLAARERGLLQHTAAELRAAAEAFDASPHR